MRKALPWILVAVAIAGVAVALSGRLEAAIVGILGLLPSFRRAKQETENEAERRGMQKERDARNVAASGVQADLAKIDAQADVNAREKIEHWSKALEDRRGRTPTPEELAASDEESRK